MVATARVVEHVVVNAYLGALTSLADPALVVTASSILTAEARHQSIIDLLSNAAGIPRPFDVALSPADVLAIMGTFISGCKLGCSGKTSEFLHLTLLIKLHNVSTNPPLTVTNSDALQAGVRPNFSSPALDGTIPEMWTLLPSH